jgi:hypothetical protein
MTQRILSLEFVSLLYAPTISHTVPVQRNFVLHVPFTRRSEAVRNSTRDKPVSCSTTGLVQLFSTRCLINALTEKGRPILNIRLLTYQDLARMRVTCLFADHEGVRRRLWRLSQCLRTGNAMKKRRSAISHKLQPLWNQLHFRRFVSSLRLAFP